MISGKKPGRFHRLSGAHLILCALQFISLIALASCRASSSSAPGGRGIDSLSEEAGYAQIASGEFLMGSPKQPARTSRFADGTQIGEHPQRRVLITRPFEMGKREVIQSQWQTVMNSNPSSFKGPELPVTNVSWNDAQEFIARLQLLDGKHTYRLPTEA